MFFGHVYLLQSFSTILVIRLLKDKRCLSLLSLPALLQALRYGGVCTWLIVNAHPLYPPLKQVYGQCSGFILFERGKEFERGLRPLSP
jgi:hypothetical protein